MSLTIAIKGGRMSGKSLLGLKLADFLKSEGHEVTFADESKTFPCKTFPDGRVVRPMDINITTGTIE